MHTALPTITSKQQQLLTHLYNYRFLTTTQLQQLMGHKDRRRVLSWLQDLRSKGYIERQYATDFIGRTKPATYYLSKNSICWFRTLDYPEAQLRKRYDESTRSPAYIENCLQVAAAVVRLKTKADSAQYRLALPTRYNLWANNTFITMIELQPSLFIIRNHATKGGVYLVEVLRRTASQRYVRNRLVTYFRHLSNGYWRDYLRVCPTVLFVCPDKVSKKYAKRLIRRLAMGDDASVAHFRFTTLDIYAANGIDSPIWEKIIIEKPKVYYDTSNWYFPGIDSPRYGVNRYMVR